ncbi:hypothetical protein FQA39_LY14828 [Lamprigera yunnana]|nr:hypothetical protein FQA39_LY14828 [Lamprigera yunnana]
MCDCSEIYCSQQINIPPTFPYLLRQYAKAAIRTQPNDLLRWSTAYFRCLALNLPPPVKPRLEYPIPRSHHGLTPGWLRALMCQFQNNLTIPFRVLWDRWIGACLEHEHLIEMLVLGGFSDPEAIPWYRFVAVCAGHLTENLTQTMIMVCNIITEEPEGGSAMVPLEVFVDIYKLLAMIDASQPQPLLNLYFHDSMLCLYREPSIILSKESTIVCEEEMVEEETELEEEKVAETHTGLSEDLLGVDISCPDILVDNYKSEDDLLSETTEKESIENKSLEQPEEITAIETTTEEKTAVETEPSVIEEDQIEEQKPEISKLEDEHEEKLQESVETLIDYMPDRQVSEYLDNLKKDQQPEEEMVKEEVDYELEKLKEMLELGPEGKPIQSVTESLPDKKEIEEEEHEEKMNYICIEAIPGIGCRVPEHIVEAFIKYIKECAVVQHGMVMPRNIRHFNCPPLEVLPV